VRSLLVVLPLLLSGCAAIAARSAVVQGQRALSQAQAADQSDRTAYERTLAEIYLSEARAQAALSSYRSSIDLARKAQTWASRASELARSPDPQEPR